MKILSTLSLFAASALAVPSTLPADQSASAPTPAATPLSQDTAESLLQQARAALSGTGVPKDQKKALDLMLKAAELGRPDALGGVGYFYATGTVVEKDNAKAIEWFRKGAEAGSAKSQLNLGLLLIASPEMEKEAREWLKKAADQGLAEANLRMGQLSYFGEHGVPQDYRKAFPFVLAAAKAGNSEAQNMTGFMLSQGMGMDKDEKEGEAWLRKAAQQGNAKAQVNLARLLDPRSKDAKTRIEALTWLYAASDKNEITAKKSLNEILPSADPVELSKARQQAAMLNLKGQRAPSASQ